MQGLRSSSPGPTSLEQAFAALRDEHVLDPNIDFRIFVVGQPERFQSRIPKEIYLIGREAIINALRHARATRIEVEIEYLRRRIRLFVRDNGCGFDSQILRFRRDSHWGLLAMKERSEVIGARLRIWSKPGIGTEVELSARGN